MTRPSEQRGDLLYGAKSIADYLDLEEHVARHRISQNVIPTFRMEGMICATKSGLDEHFKRKMAAAMMAGDGAKS